MFRDAVYPARCMGVDIYVAAERRNTSGEWERPEPLVPIRQRYSWYPESDPRIVREPVHSAYRNRVLYDVLAFGRRIGSEPLIEPIAPCRGLPADATPETVADHAEESEYGLSWLLLQEILDYDWDQEVVEEMSRRTSDHNWRAHQNRRPPPPVNLGALVTDRIARLVYALAVPVVRALQRRGHDVVLYAPASLRPRPNPPPDDPLGPEWEPCGEPFLDELGDPVQRYTSRTGLTLGEAAGAFLTETVPKLQSFGAPEDVRIVFGFG